LLDNEQTKTYLGIDGLPDYRHHVRDLVFGDSVASDRIGVAQTPGGTGGVRVACDFLADQCRGSRIWYSNPTWANHPAIFAAAGLESHTYPYLNADRTGLDFDAMIETLSTQTRSGDCVLLHACCHNPTGVDPTPEQWEQIAKIVAERKLLPMVDFAYQGFGDGLSQDAEGLRCLLKHNDEALVATSFSKNFGLYSERVGAVAIVTGSAKDTTNSVSQLKKIIRSNYSNPPRHGGAIVATVLGDQELTELWHQELADMRSRISEMRTEFVRRMAEKLPGKDYNFLLDQKGMFSYSGLSPMEVDQLKSEYAIYIVGSGRINVAGITPANIDRLCDAIAAVVVA
jgi:aspartate/tyrosine/aromatic aminotransferase